ncbi:MAG: hypothetical protein IJ498_07070 [Akkermansia sp.]|nr:hypothetical protein [Akkermansia sp.]
MPDGRNLIVSGRTSHQIALADPTVKAVKTTLIDYNSLPFVNRNSSIVISENDWVRMTNAGEHIINRTATTEHYRTYFTHNPITHAQAIEQGLVPIDPKTGRPSAAYTKGRQLAEADLAAKEQAEQQAAAKAAAETKAQAEKTLPGKTKWATPTKKSKPLSDSETRQTLISVAGKTVSTDGIRPVISLVTIQRKKGTEYTVATDGRRLTVLSRSTTAPDTETATEEFYDTKGVQYKRGDQPYPNWRQIIPLVSKHRASTTIDLSHYSFLAKGSVKGGYTKRIDSPFFKDGQRIFFNIGSHRAAINPVFMRDIYKQMQQLGKKLGFPPTLKAYYFDKKSPLLFTAEHNGNTYQSVVMTQSDHVLDENGNKMRKGAHYVYKTPDITPGDIILGEQPTIYGEETTQDTGSFSLRAKPTYTVVNDNVGLQEHLDDIVTPVEINFTPTRKKGGEWVKEALDYYLQELAGQSLPIGNTGYTLHVKATKNRAKLATYNASSQPRSEAFKKIKEVIAKAYRIGSETSESREKQSTERADRVKRTATFERFGYPAIINGETCLIWFTGQTKQADAKDVLLAETGVTARNTTGATSPLAASSTDGGDIAPATETLGDALSNVKGKIKGMPEIIKNPSQQETSVSSPQAAPLATPEQSGGGTFSLRRRPDRNTAALLNEQETTLLRVANYIKREAQRTARVLGADTEKLRAGVHYAQATAIITALDKYIFSRDLITRNSAEYRRLRALRNYAEQYITIAGKGKLPTRRATKDGHITIKAAIRELLETQLPASCNARSSTKCRFTTGCKSCSSFIKNSLSLAVKNALTGVVKNRLMPMVKKSAPWALG